MTFRFRTEPPPTQRQWDAALNMFAELLSRDMPLADIAEKMSVSVGTTCVFLRMLCERMGEQAR